MKNCISQKMQRNHYFSSQNFHSWFPAKQAFVTQTENNYDCGITYTRFYWSSSETRCGCKYTRIQPTSTPQKRYSQELLNEHRRSYLFKHLATTKHVSAVSLAEDLEFLQSSKVTTCNASRTLAKKRLDRTKYREALKLPGNEVALKKYKEISRLKTAEWRAKAKQKTKSEPFEDSDPDF